MRNTKQETNYNELVNPTFTTGQATLEMLAASGNPDAITYKELLSVSGATQKVSGSSNSQNQIFSPEEGRALMMGVTLGIEARYVAVSRLLKESGYKSMLDIASGYTPRALMCQKAGIDYPRRQTGRRRDPMFSSTIPSPDMAFLLKICRMRRNESNAGAICLRFFAYICDIMSAEIFERGMKRNERE